jgi:hypothetical protein
MGALVVVEGEVAAQAQAGRFGAVVVSQVDVFVCDRAPESFGEDVVDGTVLAVYTDLHMGGQQPVQVLRAGEMSVTNNACRRRVKSVVIGTAGIIGLSLALLLTIRLVTGQSMGLRSLALASIQSARSLGLSILNSGSVTAYSRGDFTNVIFLHHSVGYNLIDQGNVREMLANNGYNFFDHDYNQPGLRGPDGAYLGYSYNVPGDNTDPDGLVKIFSQSEFGAPLNTFGGLLQHEVIAFKSCFPASDIVNDEQLEQRKAWYLDMRDVMDRHPDKLFVVVTQPPLNPAETKPEIAARARTFANWLRSEEYLQGHPNVFTFDLFGYLAEDNPASPDSNMLRAAYREGEDSHPNQVANQAIGPLFADFIMTAAQTVAQHHSVVKG